ncbi:PQQ-binding-like beta-propeller repeat protein [Streptomyces sp. NBC_00047]|uniref:outer membrane protein assembly factor BamB family protein n=1 Tax=Streptomyces sp. NBC_00047 TaxID=2975627 RepID=UPI00225505BA|nr:PQQ-binding-like beta-propeller repeat protein [Streptomyces sp. NBC_00047]MCX5607214.1 PQQ-binding-like beta-propeller repeat protein [Streptomyces sp. NBC_00047]
MNQTPAGFGPPPEPFQPQPNGTGGGGGRRISGRTAIVLAVLAGVLLVLGGGVYLAVGGDRGKPAAQDGKESAVPSGSPSVDQGDGKGSGVGSGVYDPNAGIQPGEARVWLRDNQTEVVGAGASQYGPWRVGDIVVKAMYKEVTGYAVADGQEKWKLPLQTPLCGVPRAPSATGKLVVGVKESDSATAHCTQLQQIDLTTGTAGWKAPVPQENSYDSSLEFEMAIAGDTVAVARSAVMSGFSVTDGRKLFGTSNTNGCSPSAFAGGSRLISLRNCFAPKEPVGSARSMVEELDPATGGSKWSHTYEKGWNVGRVLSVDPLVVAAYNKEKKTWNITAFTPDGKVRSQSDAGFGVSGRCNGWGNSTGYQECYAAVADADTLYIGAGKTGPDLGIDDTRQVVAVDLNTGKEKWRTAEQPKDRTVWPLAVEDGRIVVYVRPGSGETGSVVSLAPADGSSQPLLQSPAAAAGAEGVIYDHGVRIAWAGGRLFLLNGRVASPEPGVASRAILSFGK